MSVYQKLCLVVQLRAHLVAAQEQACLVAAQERACLVAAVRRWTHLVAVVQRQTCLVKWMVLDLKFLHLRYVFF